MKYELKNYHIGEIARFYGLSVDALRLYDKKGILIPEKNEETGYRIYSKEDLVTMDYVMRMRRLDIPLDYIRQMMYDTDLETIQRIVQNQEHEISAQIKKLQKKEKLLRNYRQKIEECIAKTGQVEIIQSPVFICKDVEKSMAQVMDEFEMLEQNTIPLLTIFLSGEADVCVNLEFLERMADRNTRQQVNQYKVTMVDENDLSECEDFPAEKFQVIPSCKCIHGFGVIYTNQNYTPLSFATDFIRKHGLKPQDQPMIRFLANECDTGRNAEYLELWIPIE